jgi:hypothetical protein
MLKNNLKTFPKQHEDSATGYMEYHRCDVEEWKEDFEQEIRERLAVLDMKGDYDLYATERRILKEILGT